VKPGNILITDEGEVKVTDFGIARAVSEASMTVTGTTLGSVHYFSPEQARGDEVTGRSDVYALGIVLYEMLTGRRPFEGDSAAGVALKRLSEDPLPPTAHRPIPAGLSAIVMRALEREPERRFPDAGSFAEALRVWQRNPDAAAAAAAAAPAAGAAAAAAAAPRPSAASVPPSGEPTVYVPPRVARPSDRAPMTGVPPPRRPQARPYDERQGQPWWIWLLALLAVLLLGAMGFVGAQLLGNLGPGGSSASPSAEEFALPNWEGLTLSAARADAERRGLEVNPIDEASDDVDQGRVIRTDPEAGEQVQEGDTIDVFVSSGEDTVNVPNLVGQTRDEARGTLDRAGLTLGSVSSEPSDQEAGTVIRSDPPSGVGVARDSQVNIVLSSGPTPSPEPTPSPVPTPEPTQPPTPTPEPPPPSVEPSVLPI
jgi:serine/threonine-protein kinase